MDNIVRTVESLHREECLNNPEILEELLVSSFTESVMRITFRKVCRIFRKKKPIKVMHNLGKSYTFVKRQILLTNTKFSLRMVNKKLIFVFSV